MRFSIAFTCHFLALSTLQQGPDATIPRILANSFWHNLFNASPRFCIAPISRHTAGKPADDAIKWLREYPWGQIIDDGYIPLNLRLTSLLLAHELLYQDS